MREKSPFGSWKSPITPEQMASKSVDYSFPRFCDGQLFWMEFRPNEASRTVIVQRSESGDIRTLTPDGLSVQTKAHEYGGCCYAVGAGKVFFVNAKDQRIYQQSLNNPATAKPLSPDFEGRAETYRYADLICDKQRQRIVTVAEVHFSDGREPKACLVSVSLTDGKLTTLETGADFYAHPRLSPSGDQLLWLEWNHPNMPWDQTQLCHARFDSKNQLAEKQQIGGNGESIFQPEWSPNGEIYYVSDRNQWWNLYRHEANQPVAVFSSQSECGLPLWQFGMTTWGFLSESELLVSHCIGGKWQLSRVNIATGEQEQSGFLRAAREGKYNHYSHLVTDDSNSTAAVIASGPTTKNQLLYFVNNELEQAAPPTELGLSEEDVSTPNEIRFPTTDGDHAFAYFYAPTNHAYESLPDERPPLIVLCHGGPTASTTAAFNLKVQFWTSRGFAVVDVNYRGSTGYGRNYRDKLKGKWGIYDIDDACAAAAHVVNQGWADPERLIIRGSSAGGYTVLGALCFRDVFSAGCSLYGIGDLNALAKDTHKFESRYTDALIAEIDQTEIYKARSPICHITQFDCPTIFFQGLKDKVVPPEQAEAMVAALNDKKIPVALVTYPEEAHGFRQTDNVIHAFNAELAFYGKVFGFETDSTVENLEILNLVSK